MTAPHLIDKEIASATGTIARGVQISVDDTPLSNLNTTDAQQVTEALDSLITRVNGITPGGGNPNQFNRPIATFTETVDIDDVPTFEMFDDELALYAANANNRLEFRLPTDATIGSNFPVTLLILHQGGTERFTTGPIFAPPGEPFGGPDNTIRLSAQGGEELRRNTEDGTLLSFSEIHQNDLATITKEDADSPWVVRTVTLSSGALLLPDGVFNLNPTVTISFFTTLTFLSLSQSDISVSAGDAFRVIRGDENFAGFGVSENDVLVALKDNPSRLRSSDNEDWLIIRNAHNSEISLTELHFLNQVTEVDSFTYTRLEEESDVTAARVFLSPRILTTAPFINPSTDTVNNPSNTPQYIGGDEQDGADFDFQADTTAVGNFDNVASAPQAPNALVYVDFDGTFDMVNRIGDVFLEHIDIDGEVIQRYSLGTEFRGVVLPGSGDTYYVLDTIGATDNYSSLTYHVGQTINVVLRNTSRQFNISQNVNLISTLKDNSIPSTKLDLNTQALLNADHSLDDEQEAKLDGLQTDGTATPWTAGDLYVKINDHASNDLANYQNVGQGNGILSEFDHTRTITFLVPNFVTVTQLQRTDDNSIKNPVTRIGTILGRQAFTSVLPTSGFDINNPVGDIWQVDGTASNRFLSGADDTFKVHVGNLGEDVLSRTSPVTPPQLPDVLQALDTDLTRTVRTTTGWREASSSTLRHQLTRQFAALWDENRRSFTGNYFEDITGVEVIGYANNNIFWYNDPNDELNTGFPGSGSYIENSNVRIRNISGATTPITDSFRKIIAFDYALERELNNGEEAPMLRIGSASTTPLIGLSEQEGLYLNIGRGDGGTRTRTITRNLNTHGSGGISYPFGSLGGVSTTGEAEFDIANPNDPLVAYPITYRVKVRLDNNGNDEGTFQTTYTVTDEDVSQGRTTFTSSHAGYGSKTWGIRFEHNFTHVTFGVVDVIFIDDSDSPETNQALTYYVSVEYDVTESYTVPATYAREPINAGDGHDDFGLFDPHLYNTEHVQERNRVTLSIEPWDLTDVSTDPELAVRVVVDGELEGGETDGLDEHKIRLHRTASEFDFSDMNFGNTICAVSHIQCYDYGSGLYITGPELLHLYSLADRWLGAFINSTDSTDVFQLDANWEILHDPTVDRGLILRDTENTNRFMIQVVNGVLTASQL
ncbi:MAG: hypothetical protein ACEPOW_13765 [Bacteroidales bacterium]